MVHPDNGMLFWQKKKKKWAIKSRDAMEEPYIYILLSERRQAEKAML